MPQHQQHNGKRLPCCLQVLTTYVQQDALLLSIPQNIRVTGCPDNLSAQQHIGIRLHWCPPRPIYTCAIGCTAALSAQQDILLHWGLRTQKYMRNRLHQCLITQQNTTASNSTGCLLGTCSAQERTEPSGLCANNYTFCCGGQASMSVGGGAAARLVAGGGFHGKHDNSIAGKP